MYLQQNADGFQVTRETRMDQRGVSIVILFVQLGIALQQKPHNLTVTDTNSGIMKWCVYFPLDILIREELNINTGIPDTLILIQQNTEICQKYV